MKFHAIGLFLIIFCLFLLSGCFQTKETINPSFTPKSLDEQYETNSSDALKNNSDESGEKTTNTDEKKTFTIKMKYYIKDIKFDPEDGTTNRGFVGNILERIGKAFAVAIMKVGGNFDLDMSPISFEIPDLGTLEDSDVIKEVKITKIRFDITNLNENKSNQYSTNFLQEAKIYLNIINNKNSEKTTKRHLAFSYHKKNNRCNFNCIEFNINDMDILSILKDANKISISPSVKIGDAPKTNMKAEGFIEFAVKVAMPY